MANKRLQKKKAAAALKLETKKTEAPKIETKKEEPLKVASSKEKEPLIPASPEEEFIYNARFHRFYDELKWLYCEQYRNYPEVALALNVLVSEMKSFYFKRTDEQKTQDKKRSDFPCWYKTLPVFAAEAGNRSGIEPNTYLYFTTEPGELSENPEVFNQEVFHMLSLANQGADMILIDKNFENLPKNHSVIRMIRIIFTIVCPGVLLLGTTDNFSFFGTKDKPELHILCTDKSMAVLWHTAATRDVSLLRHQIDSGSSLPETCAFFHYVRNRHPVCWNLDYTYLNNFAVSEEPHRKYLNDFFTGKFPGSYSEGSLFDASDENSGITGTTGTLCGIQHFASEGNSDSLKKAVRFHISLHAFIFSLPGIPTVYKGDAFGELNSYSSGYNPALVENSRISDTIQGTIFTSLQQLQKIHSSCPVFAPCVPTRTIDTWDTSVLALVREAKGEKFIGIYNFSEYDKTAWINEEDGIYTDLISGREMEAKGVNIPAFGFLWLLRK